MGEHSVSDAPIRALIVDDEPRARAAIRALLAGDPDISIVGEAADGATARQLLEHDPPELVFLDVQMPVLNGFEVLRGLPGLERLVVVFVTAYDEYALRAFDVHAVDYLLKPFDDQRFHSAVAHAKREVRQRRLGTVSDWLQGLLETAGRRESESRGGEESAASRYSRRFVIKAGGRITILPVRDLDWVEAERDYVKLHSGKFTHVLRATMQQMEQELDPAQFVRIHRSTIVNVDRIRELQPYFRGEFMVILYDGNQLKLARSCKERLEAALGRPF